MPDRRGHGQRPDGEPQPYGLRASDQGAGGLDLSPAAAVLPSHVRLGADWSALLVIGLLGLDGPWHLALDRTNWKVGGKDVNILMLAIVTRRFRVPLLWSVLTHSGNSSSAQRIALMRRYLALFDAASIELLLADREFIGAEWIKFLIENDIPFAIRMKEKLTVTTEDGRRLALGSLLRKCRGVRTFPRRSRPRRGPPHDAGSLVAELRRKAPRRRHAAHRRLQHPVGDPAPFAMRRLRGLLGEGGGDCGGDQAPAAPGGMMAHVADEMHAAVLPAGRSTRATAALIPSWASEITSSTRRARAGPACGGTRSRSSPPPMARRRAPAPRAGPRR